LSHPECVIAVVLFVILRRAPPTLTRVVVSYVACARMVLANRFDRRDVLLFERT
jgi:hypothetical protein